MASSKVTRAVIGLPILAFSIGCFLCMGRDEALLHLEEILSTGNITWDSVDIPIIKSFYRVGFLDEIFRGVSIAFGPAAFGVDPVAWYQMFSFLLDISLLPILFGLPMQVLSAGVVVPLFPVWFGLCQIFLPYTIAAKTNRMKNTSTQAAQVAVKVFAVVSGVAWIYVNLMSPYSPITLYYPKAVEQATFPEAMRRYVQADQVFSFGAGFLWLLYLIGDMKNSGLVERSWSSLLARGAAVFVLSGPGTLVAVAWLWRNDILTRQKFSLS
ncbi:hypothetical protein NHQ30_004510 [Ciborinia camelliae]|nr:hypothetical protein NHQ30_004510 [Ciborinia camelliae]